MFLAEKANRKKLFEMSSSIFSGFVFFNSDEKWFCDNGAFLVIT